MNVSETWFSCRDKLNVSLNHGDVICLRPFGFVHCAAGRATECEYHLSCPGLDKGAREEFTVRRSTSVLAILLCLSFGVTVWGTVPCGLVEAEDG